VSANRDQGELYNIMW